MLEVSRSTHPEAFLGKGFLKTYSKFTGEHQCRRAMSVKLEKKILIKVLIDLINDGIHCLISCLFLFKRTEAENLQ